MANQDNYDLTEPVSCTSAITKLKIIVESAENAGKIIQWAKMETRPAVSRIIWKIAI